MVLGDPLSRCHVRLARSYENRTTRTGDEE
jgi:hypothetical protein